MMTDSLLSIFGRWYLVGAIGVAVTVSPAPATELLLLEDNGEDRFQVTLETGPGKKSTVSRTTVEGMNYDGPPGYTAMLVREEVVPGPGVRREVLTLFVSGQYRLLAFEPTELRLYACELHQQGAGVRIRAIQSFSADSVEGETVGPPGVFQYASCNPTSSHCVLVDSAVTFVDLATGAAQRIHVTPPIPGDAADPYRQTDSGFHVGAGYSLD